MEADWSAEVGGDAARMEADWTGFVDLRRDAAAIEAVTEAAAEPGLRAALLLLNGAGSPVFTAKCDVWTLEPDELDPFEYDFPPEEKPVGMASYVDVLARDAGAFASFERQEAWARRVVDALRRERLGNGRADVVIRAALAGGAEGFGMTLYAAGCGADGESARGAWEAILERLADVTMMEAQSLRGE